jgi:hypothetical protein
MPILWLKINILEWFFGLLSKEVSSHSKRLIKQISKSFIYKLIKKWGRIGDITRLPCDFLYFSTRQASADFIPGEGKNFSGEGGRGHSGNFCSLMRNKYKMKLKIFSPKLLNIIYTWIRISFSVEKTHVIRLKEKYFCKNNVSAEVFTKYSITKNYSVSTESHRQTCSAKL